MSLNKITQEILVALLVMMFTYAAISKLLIYDEYRFELLGHELIRKYAATIAWAIPALELGIVSLLVFNPTRKAGLLASAGLLFLFTLYIIYMYRIYPSVPCTCGGILGTLSWKHHILFNLFFIMAALTVILIGNKEQPPAQDKYENMHA